ncbi:Hydroxymethylglutaryl-CoA lyase YngG [uncultured delta proteobacterium]|uniref:Hydroxymethylglutaryl-CoA lyase YngG n=1 Tax=uncultured delta proteobacterium TaxID=34034 RepID=A0A212KGY8_9DELT|nr:Hydroxymethylglutaryl-CoA lyase YngG [uncultured delta proteobacterium]
MSTAQIIDVTARDGFQNLKDWIPTEIKVKVLDQLAAAGIKRLEATSFVSPKAVPQMADAADVLRHMAQAHPGVETDVLAPNLRGAQNAVEAGAKQINYVISVSREHNMANIKRTHEESLADLASIIEAFPQLNISVALATVFGCPFVGCVPTADTLALAEKVAALGIRSVILADTIGVANPRQVRGVYRDFRAAFPDMAVRLHLHDTHGMGLANMLAALDAGCTVFETATGGLGGCPFAPGAAGNTATEDAVNMLHRMGVATGINLERLLDVVKTLRENVKASLPGRFSVARGFQEFCFYEK